MAYQIVRLDCKTFLLDRLCLESLEDSHGIHFSLIPGDQRSAFDLDGGHGELCHHQIFTIFSKLCHYVMIDHNDHQVITLIWEFTLLSILFSYEIFLDKYI